MSKPDLFELLKRIDLGDYQYISSMSDAEKKSVPPFILLKWMAFTDDKNKMLMLASAANQQLFKLYRFPDLCYNLLCVSGTNNPEFYKWRKRKVVATTRPITVRLLKEYYKIGTTEATEDSILMNLDSMLAIVDALGEWDSIDGITKEYNNV